MRAGHASYSPAQIILAKGRTVVFDWDDYDVADPARDAARFIVALRRLAMGKLGSIRALDGAGQVFLRTYQSEAHLGTEENLRFFEAAACHTLAVYLLSHQVPRWVEKLEAMLDEGLRIFEMELVR
jgi:aminoglycoside phosphotransferase (APT) family kinase protein